MYAQGTKTFMETIKYNTTKYKNFEFIGSFFPEIWVNDWRTYVLHTLCKLTSFFGLSFFWRKDASIRKRILSTKMCFLIGSLSVLSMSVWRWGECGELVPWEHLKNSHEKILCCKWRNCELSKILWRWRAWTSAQTSSSTSLLHGTRTGQRKKNPFQITSFPRCLPKCSVCCIIESLSIKTQRNPR